MRNLKRVLALAMAMVMILGMMVIGSSAASYTDADAIDAKYTEAVEVLSGLGVFRGTGDGFEPKTELDRASAAALIYRVITGDVEDKQIANYDYASLKDIQAGAWYTPYVTYANNGGYIKGDDLGNFNPNAKVTGIQVMAIMLRAAGYGQNGEYEGAAWKDNILTDAKELGITGSISTATLNAPATRELVAQLIFNAMTNVKMVSYAPLLGYYKAADAQTLGEKVFALAEIDGVVTANEYANLNGTKVLKAGKTTIGDVTYNVSTEITDIGESRVGWAAGKNVVYLVDSGDNTVWENDGAKTDLDTKWIKANGIYLTDAEKFVNFEDVSVTSYTTDIRIVYSLDGTAPTAAQKIAANGTMTAAQYADIVDIFTNDDYENGWVLVGTTYTDVKSAVEKDVSNTMTLKEFTAKYLTKKTSNAQVVTGAVNGDWLKVIDNDGNGEADYVFLTTFAMRKVDDISKKGVITMSAVDKCDDYAAGAALTVDPAATTYTIVADEIAERDIVLTTYIDGVYYINLAEVVTDTIDKKGIDTRNETITCGDNVYGQSGIAHDDAMACDITDAATEVSYDFYLDHFGYVRLYEQSAWSKGFVLLTDGYYWSDKRTDDYKAEIWNGDFADVDVLANTADDAKGVWYNNADNFIDPNEDDSGDRGTWDRLYEAEQVYGWAWDEEEEASYMAWANDYVTNIAGYSANAEDQYSLIYIGGNNVSNKTVYNVEELVIDNTTDKLTDKQLTDGTDRIQATTDTVYYLVTVGKKGIDTIETWTGYANAPKVDLKDYGHVQGYAVTSNGSNNGYSYDIADVVVIELYDYLTDDLYFVYDATNYNYITLAYDAETETYVADTQVAGSNRTGTASFNEGVDYYVIDSNGTATVIDTAELGEYAAENIYYAVVNTAQFNVGRRDYVQFVAGGAASTYEFTDTFCSDDVTIYTIGYNSAKNYHTLSTMDYADVEIGDKLIVVTDGTKQQNIEYVINVTASLYVDKGDDKAVAAAQTLYAAIVADAAEPVATEDKADLLYKVAFNGNEYVIETEANTYDYIVEIKASEAVYASGTPVFTATALSNASDVTIKHGNGTVAGATAKSSTSDTKKTTDITDKSVWTVVIDEVEFTVGVKLVNETLEAASAAELAAALTNAVDGDTIKLTANINLGNTSIELKDDKAITIDLDGMTVASDVDAFIVEKGTLTITGDGNVYGGNGDTSASAVWAKGGDVIIENGTFYGDADSSATTGPTHTNDAIYAAAGSTITINGGTFSCHESVWLLNLKDNTNSSIVVNAGTFINFDPSNNVSEGANTNFVAATSQVSWDRVDGDDVYTVTVK